MQKVSFLQECTIYPDGKLPVLCRANVVLNVEDDYASLLVAKGHAEFVAASPAAAESPNAAPAPTSLGDPAE